MSKQVSSYVIQENPLLFEKNRQDQYDAIIVVIAPLQMRIDRVMARDGVSQGDVEARVRNQMDQGHKEKLASYVIENDGDLRSCQQAVNTIHKNILSEIP